MKNNKLLSTLIYIYIIILTFIVLYYIYSNSKNTDYFDDTPIQTRYNQLLSSTNITNINDFLDDYSAQLSKNIEINNNNKAKINELMENGIDKLKTMIDNYVLSI